MNKQSVLLAIWLGVLHTRCSCAPQLREGQFVVGERSGGRVAKVELNRNVGNVPTVIQTNVPELTRVVTTAQPLKTQQILRVVSAPQNLQYEQTPQGQKAQSQYERELAQYRQALAEYQQKTQGGQTQLQQRVYQVYQAQPQQPINQQPYYQQQPQYSYNYYPGLQQRTPSVRSSSNSLPSFTSLFSGFSNAFGVGSLFGF